MSDAKHTGQKDGGTQSKKKDDKNNEADKHQDMKPLDAKHDDKKQGEITHSDVKHDKHEEKKQNTHAGASFSNKMRTFFFLKPKLESGMTIETKLVLPVEPAKIAPLSSSKSSTAVSIPEKKDENSEQKAGQKIPAHKDERYNEKTGLLKKSLSERLGSFLHRKDTVENVDKKNISLSGVVQKKKRRKLQKKSLQEYLDKAGYGVSADWLKKIIFRVVLVIFGVCSLFVLYFAVDHSAKALDVILFVFGLWTAVFAGVMLIIWAAVFFFLDYRIYGRTKELEDVLPDFLQLASSNIAAGMPIDRALWFSIRPSFGVLAKEMEEVAKATMTGEDLEESLMHFADRYESVTLKRSISILIEGLHAGGEMADLLNKIALNVDEMKIMKKEMAANVTTYAIFILFASIIISPFLFALSTELLTIIIKITGSLDAGSSSSSVLSIAKPDPMAVKNFKIFSVLMLLVSAVFSASIVSVIKNGNVMDGIKSIPIYAFVSITIYYFGSMMLHGVLGGII